MQYQYQQSAAWKYDTISSLLHFISNAINHFNASCSACLKNVKSRCWCVMIYLCNNILYRECKAFLNRGVFKLAATICAFIRKYFLYHGTTHTNKSIIIMHHAANKWKTL